MAKVAVTCPSCEDVMVPASKVSLTVCDTTGVRRCVYQCPKCLAFRTREINDTIAVALTQLGAPTRTIYRPEELDEPVRARGDVTFDDVDLAVACSVLDRAAGVEDLFQP